MSQKYTHENVPQEIAKKFPGLQAKQAATKNQAPAHVIEAVRKNSVHGAATTVIPAGTVASAITTINAVPGTTVAKQSVVVSKPTVVHHAPAAHVVQKHAVVATQPVVVAQKPAVVATKPVVVAKTVKPAVNAVVPHKQGAAFTHENVPADIHKKFPTLKGKVQPKPANNTQVQVNQPAEEKVQSS